MVIPTFSKKPKRRVMKLCAYPDCNMEFYGTPGVGKYCDIHKNDPYRLYAMKKRNRLSKIAESQLRNDNIEIIHTGLDAVVATRKCGLHGCPNEYQITLSRKTKVYPRFCEDHRSEYRRQLFTRTHNEIL